MSGQVTLRKVGGGAATAATAGARAEAQPNSQLALFFTRRSASNARSTLLQGGAD